MTRQRTALFDGTTVTVDGTRLAILDGPTAVYAAGYDATDTAKMAYQQICCLFADGHHVADVVAFAQAMAPAVDYQPEVLPELCEVAA